MENHINKKNNTIVRASEPVAVLGMTERRILAEIAEADLMAELAALADDWFAGRPVRVEKVG